MAEYLLPHNLVSTYFYSFKSVIYFKSNVVCFIYDKVVMGFENIEVASIFE